MLNALTGQDVAIVSDVAGTTTDPVEKPMELLPIGPVLFVDTAGLDDVGALGRLRIQKTAKVLERTDVALLVTEAATWGVYEEGWAAELRRRKIPTLVILNKTDIDNPSRITENIHRLGLNWCAMSAVARTGVLQAKEAIIKTTPASWYEQGGILDGMIEEGDTVVLVVPIDKEAPKGRLILPQVQTLRDILDKRATAVVTNEERLGQVIEQMKARPRLVITDSQVFAEVADRTPPDVPMTSFSVIFGRYKGSLSAFVSGARAIDGLKESDRVLIAEACTHHPIEDDIARGKIPRWLQEKAGTGLACDIVSGHDFPEQLEPYSLVIHCGACMFNRREMLSRILACQQQGVAITNYGVAIAHLRGILKRALLPFGYGRRQQPCVSRPEGKEPDPATGSMGGSRNVAVTKLR